VYYHVVGPLVVIKELPITKSRVKSLETATLRTSVRYVTAALMLYE